MAKNRIVNPDENLDTVSSNVHTDSANRVDSGVPYADFHETDMPRGSDEVPVGNSGETRTIEALQLPHSQFSDYHLFRLSRFGSDNGNYPMTDEATRLMPNLYKNITVVDLIENPVGASVYKAEDFLYAADFKKQVPMNRLITLRRFAYPCVDDITGEMQTEPDVSRMITYSHQDENKLSELLSFSFGMRWKELKSSFEQMNMHGPQNGIGGFMRKALQFVDPMFGQNALRGDVANTFDPLHDTNKVYGPVDSIDSTHIRDIGLDFDQDIKLVFKYEMRSINGINQKAAFIDLLSNVFACCTNDAKFWGGSRYWLNGNRPTKYLKDLKFLSPTSFNDFVNKAHIGFKGFLGTLAGDSGGTDAVSTLKTIAKNAFNLGFGKLLDKVGRPGIPYMNSLLTGNPVGEWHVTIGNPRNPIMVMGNLLLTNTTIHFSDELGYDDFPNEITVECTLKHAMPRGRAEIESMFNNGLGRTYWKPKDVVGSLQETQTSGGGTETSPNHLFDYIQNASTVIGDFNVEDMLRNARAAWSFEKLDS